MKRKLSARTITLITLIAALICAIFASFAFMSLEKNTSNDSQDSNYIYKPEKKAKSTSRWGQYGYDNDGEYDYWLEVESENSELTVGDRVTVHANTDNPNANPSKYLWYLSGSCQPIRGGDGYSWMEITITSVGVIHGYVDFGVWETNYGDIPVSNKGTYNMSSAKWNYSSAFTYDGGTKTVSVTGLPSGVTVKSYSGNSATNAGSYTASVTFNYDSANYNAPYLSNCYWTINRAGISQPTLSKSSFTYSTGSQTFTISSVSYISVSLPSGWSRNGTTVTIPAGATATSYNVSVTPDSNHQWSSGSNVTSARTFTVTIDKANQTASITGSSTVIYGSTITLTGKGTGTLNWSSSNTGIASVSNQGVVTGVKPGTVTITLTANGNSNYNPATATKTITVIKATPSATASLQSGTYYIGNILSTVGLTGNANVAGTFGWSAPTTVLTATGSYEWTFTPSDTTNYNSVKGTLTVVAVPPLDHITVTGAKTSYKAYESFTTTGMVVTAVGGGNSKAVTNYTLTLPYTSAGRNHFLVSDSGSSVTVTYTEGNVTKSANVQITVSKADYDMSAVVFRTTTVTYDGQPKSITVSGTLPSGVEVTGYTYDGTAGTSRTDAGSYAVAPVFKINDSANRNVPSMSATLTISKATPEVTVTVTDGMFYVGDELSVAAISLKSANVPGSLGWTTPTTKLSGLSVQYGWTFVPDDTKNYNNATGNATVNAVYRLASIAVTSAKSDYKAYESFDISKAVITATYAAGKNPTAVTGFTVTYPGDNEYFTVVDNGKNVVITYTENGITKTCTLAVTVNKADYNMSAVSMTNDTITYDGEEHSIEYAGTLPEGVTVTGYTYNGSAATGATNAGTYAVVAVITIADPDNYKLPELKATLLIKKATPTIDVTGVKTEYVYTGELQTVDRGATVDNSEQTVKYSDNTFTTVAEGNGLNVKIYVEESQNYLAAEKKVELTANKATPTIDVSGVKTDYVYTGELQTIDSGATVDNDEQTVLYADNTFTTVAEGDGLNVKIYVEESDNYLAFEDSVQIAVDKARVEDTFTFDDKIVTYDGGIHSPKVAGTLTDEITVTYYYEGTTDLFSGESDVAKYGVTAHFECTTGNYYDPNEMTATLTIEPYKVSDGEVSGIDKTYPYKAAAWKPEPVVKVTLVDGGATLDGGNYDVTHSTEEYVAGTQVTVTVTFKGNYSGTAERVFQIIKADVEVDPGYNAPDKLYAGAGLPEIFLKRDATAGSLTVAGEIAWQQIGDEPPALELNSNDYVWIFTPDDTDNFNVTTGVINLTAEQATVIGLTVNWRSDIEVPKIYTSTTLTEVRDYLSVKGELAGNMGYVDIVGYQITGSWGAEANPAADKAGTYFYTVTFNGKKATLLNVVYNAILIVDLKVEAATAEGIKTTYDGLDVFDRNSITVTVVYNDGSKIENVKDYKIIYPDNRAELWAGDKQVTLSYNNGSLEEDIKHVIDVTVEMKEYDLSEIGIEDMTVDYDGNSKAYAIKGEFGAGTVSYTYARQTNGEWQTVAAANVKDAGAYRVTVKFTLEGEKNIANYYPVQSQEISLEIKKVDYANVEEIDFALSAADYDYGNSVAAKMTVQNLPDGVKAIYEYKDANGNVLSADEVVNAGTYTVKVTFEVDGNHYAIAPIEEKFTINKLKPAVDPTVGGSLSQGTKLYQLSFMGGEGVTPGTFKWVDDEYELQAGVNRCYYTFVPEDSTNFEVVKSYIDLNVGATEEESASAGGQALLWTVLLITLFSVLLAVFALIVASRKKPVVNDSDGFYDDATEEQLT